MATHSSTLAWKIPWAEEPGGLQSMWLRRVKERATTWAYLPIRAQNGEDGYNDNATGLRNHRRSSGLER